MTYVLQLDLPFIFKLAKEKSLPSLGLSWYNLFSGCDIHTNAIAMQNVGGMDVPAEARTALFSAMEMLSF